MNLRCSFCQTPFTIGRIEKLDALQHLEAHNLNHYDAHCPRCRRATPVPRQKLEMTMPNWREALNDLEKEMASHPQREAPLPKPEADSVPQAEANAESVAAPAREKSAAKTASPKESASKPKAIAKAKPAAKKNK